MEWLIFALLFGVAFFYVKDSIKTAPVSRPKEPTQDAPPVQPGAALHHWTPHKDYDHDFEVVGESNYQSSISKIVGEHGDQSPNLKKIAKLVPESGNPYDSSAVRVEIDGRTVGYLSRDDARSFRRRLSAKKLSGQPTTCGAMIMGGFVRSNGERASYGVVLDMKPFE